MKISYDMDTMKYSTLFESVTRTRLKDCFKEGDAVVFVVMPGMISKAIGKGAANVKKISQMLKKTVKVVEFNPDLCLFIQNLFRDVSIDVSSTDDIVIITCPDTKTKGQVYGRERERFNRVKDLVSRYFKIKDIKVE